MESRFFFILPDDPEPRVCPTSRQHPSPTASWAASPPLARLEMPLEVVSGQFPARFIVDATAA